MKYLVWTDLETDGLEPGIIVELACVVTDMKLNELESFHTLVAPPEGYVWDEESWAYKTHKENGLLEALANNHSDGPPISKAAHLADEFDEFLYDVIGAPEKEQRKRTACLAGNSVHFDHKFLSACAPPPLRHLHYRMLDISAVRLGMEVALGQELEMPKKLAHRALDDINESIEQFKWLWNKFSDEVPATRDRSEMFSWEKKTPSSQGDTHDR